MPDVIKAIPDLTPEQRVSTLRQNMEVTSTFIPFSQEEIEYSIPKRFEYVVAWNPDQLAVKTDSQSLTYGALDKVSNQVAHAILAQQGIEAEPVILLLEHGVAPIVAILGVLKAGKFYVTLDPSSPHSRLTAILEDTQAGLLVTNYQNLALATELSRNGQQVINIDELGPHFSNEKVNISPPADSLSAIFYTSGSTGKPKGVVWDHRSILHTIWQTVNVYRLCVQDRHALLFFCGFGVSKTDIFNALLTGATLYPYSLREVRIDQLENWLMHEGITIFRLPMTLFRQWLSTLTGETHFPKLRMIMLGGQSLYTHDVERFRKYFPKNSVLIHTLGTSEIGGIARFIIDEQTEIAGNIVPAGYAVGNKEILLLDESGQKIGFNQVGEIAIRSRYLPPGYWRNPDLMRQKFLPDPAGRDHRIYFTGDLGRMRPDGCLEHLGRKDFQVKIRGYRVELTEIEAALYRLETIKEVVVVARDDHTGEKSLAAYAVPCRQPAPTPRELRRALAATLPDYMIPSVFVILDALPLTPHGKVDRHALPAPEHIHREEEGSFVAPGTPTETLLAEIWQEVLGVDRVGVYDNFFDLGGHSLLVMQMIAKVEKRIKVRLHPRDLMFQTLGQVASVCEKQMYFPQEPGPKSLINKLWEILKHPNSRTYIF